MERNENGTIEKKEQERNNRAEGPRSRTERNDLKKVGTCTALAKRSGVARVILTHKFDSLFLLVCSEADLF